MTGLVTQHEAEAMARSVAELIGRPASMAIVLTTDDDGRPTHEYCPKGMVDTLYGPLLKAEVARVVSTVTVNRGGRTGCAAAPVWTAETKPDGR